MALARNGGGKEVSRGCREEALNTVVQVAWHPVGLVWFGLGFRVLRSVWFF